VKFGVVKADPPWNYDNAGVEGSAEGEYPTMTIDDLCALPVAGVCADACVLVLWATWPLLDQAFRLIAAWGFTYKTGFPWMKLDGDPQRSLLTGEYEYKPQYGTGFWVRGCSEPLLIAVRGDAKPYDARHFCGIVSENFFHSRKPQNIYEYAEAMRGPYLELFARRPRDGWTALGNEIDGRDIRDSLPALIAREGDQD
jgi:N6-adenosine-specific RNA methylase IME4